MNLSAGSILGLALSASEDLKLDIVFTNGVATFSNHAFFEIKASGEVFVLSRGGASIFLTDKNMTLTLTSGHKYDPATGSVTEITPEERRKYSRIGPPPPGPPEAEVVPPPPKPGQGSGMGGSLRKF